MVPSERTVTVGVGHGKRAARHDRRLAARRDGPSAGRSTPSATFDMLQPVVLRRRRAAPAARARPGDARVEDFDEVVGGLTLERGDLRGGPVPVVRQLLRVRRLPRRLPGGRGHQARRRAPLPVRLRPVHRLRRVLRAVPGARDRDGPGAAADARHDRRQRGGGVGRLPAQRAVLHLPDHAVLADGRAGRRVGEPAAHQRLGHRARRSSRCRARAGRRARCTARCRAGR